MESSEISRETIHKKIPQSVSEWQKWIETNIENFEGEVGNAALLMQGFIEGINYIQKKTSTGIVKEFQNPDIIVTADDNPDLPNIYCAADGKKIYIKKGYLGKASNFDPNSMRTAISKNGEIVFNGTTQDLFRLTGAEEGHHASLLQAKLKTSTYDSKKITVAEYNADKAEYEALKWKARYAEEMHMPDVTIAILKKQLNDAIAVRKRPIT